MKLVWSSQSLQDLTAVHTFISNNDPKAAREIVVRIVSLVEEKLPSNPYLGRPGRVAGTRELVVPGTPFIVPYRVKRESIEIARVYHAARRWPSAL
ncbi:MAG: type II toxin-antitoxin system RelE/ParE family toxin [Alphaproteobacteria bacterium]|nr:type II toxin-antitoxin system RelE/ParE family toxin [Alphaproteobacteria bacterium]